jgi:predicted ATPase
MFYKHLLRLAVFNAMIFSWVGIVLAMDQNAKTISSTTSSMPVSVFSNSKFILTGGPGVGKTSVIEKLKEKGYTITEEAFTALFDETVKRSQDKGLSKKEAEDNFWGEVKTDPINFRRALMCKQFELETVLPKQDVIFIDRGTPDIVAFGDIFGVYMTPGFRALAAAHEYNKYVFFLDPLPRKFFKQTVVRHETYEESLATHNRLKAVYSDFGYTIIDVPFYEGEFEQARANRTQFIVDAVNIVRSDDVSKLAPYVSLNSGDIKKVFNSFAGKTKDFEVNATAVKYVNLIVVKRNNKIYRFYGIHKDNQSKVDFAQLKSELGNVTGVKNSKIIQIVGDSSKKYVYTKEGTIFARNILKNVFDQDCIIEYGYTGNVVDDQLDINAFVNEYADRNPSKANKIVANIVGHSYIALTRWGCLVSPQVQTFTVIYNDNGLVGDLKEETYTTFGQDVITSDTLCDEIFCLEGGAQSFNQVINVLAQNKPVTIVTGLRQESVAMFFNASDFFKYIKGKLSAAMEKVGTRKKKIKNVDALKRANAEKIIESYIRDYEKNHKGTPPFDKSRGDYNTKMKLLDDGIAKFLDQKLYNRLDQIKFEELKK